LVFLDHTPFNIPGFDFVYVDGHTEKMALPKLIINGQTILFCADLLPSSYHVPMPYVMCYDVRPLLTMEEKARVLAQAAAGNWILAFEHDPVIEAATVEMTEKGVKIKDKGALREFINRGFKFEMQLPV